MSWYNYNATGTKPGPDSGDEYENPFGQKPNPDNGNEYDGAQATRNLGGSQVFSTTANAQATRNMGQAETFNPFSSFLEPPTGQKPGPDNGDEYDTPKPPPVPTMAPPTPPASQAPPPAQPLPTFANQAQPQTPVPTMAPPTTPVPTVAAPDTRTRLQELLDNPKYKAAFERLLGDAAGEGEESLSARIARAELDKQREEALRQTGEASARAGRLATGQTFGDVESTRRFLLGERADAEAAIQAQEQKDALARRGQDVGMLTSLATTGSAEEQGEAERAQEANIENARMAFQRGERIDSQGFELLRQDIQNKFARGERLETQDYEILRQDIQNRFITGERIGAQDFEISRMGYDDQLQRGRMTLNQQFNLDMAEFDHMNSRDLAELNGDIASRLSAQGFSQDQILQAQQQAHEYVIAKENRDANNYIALAQLALDRDELEGSLGIQREQLEINRAESGARVGQILASTGLTNAQIESLKNSDKWTAIQNRLDFMSTTMALPGASENEALVSTLMGGLTNDMVEAGIVTPEEANYANASTYVGLAETEEEFVSLANRAGLPMSLVAEFSRDNYDENGKRIDKAGPPGDNPPGDTPKPTNLTLTTGSGKPIDLGKQLDDGSYENAPMIYDPVYDIGNTTGDVTRFIKETGGAITLPNGVVGRVKGFAEGEGNDNPIYEIEIDDPTYGKGYFYYRPTDQRVIAPDNPYGPNPGPVNQKPGHRGSWSKIKTWKLSLEDAFGEHAGVFFTKPAPAPTTTGSGWSTALTPLTTISGSGMYS